jgi:hypothetical protein
LTSQPAEGITGAELIERRRRPRVPSLGGQFPPMLRAAFTDDPTLTVGGRLRFGGIAKYAKAVGQSCLQFIRS